MAKYEVTLKKIEIYTVEANNEDEATDLACQMCDENPDAWSWLEPANEIIVKEIDEK